MNVDQNVEPKNFTSEFSKFSHFKWKHFSSCTSLEGLWHEECQFVGKNWTFFYFYFTASRKATLDEWNWLDLENLGKYLSKLEVFWSRTPSCSVSGLKSMNPNCTRKNAVSFFFHFTYFVHFSHCSSGAKSLHRDVNFRSYHYTSH